MMAREILKPSVSSLTAMAKAPGVLSPLAPGADFLLPIHSQNTRRRGSASVGAARPVPHRCSRRAEVFRRPASPMGLTGWPRAVSSSGRRAASNQRAVKPEGASRAQI